MTAPVLPSTRMRAPFGMRRVASVAEMTDAVRVMGGTDNPQANAARQAEVLKASYERAVANMREVADLIQKSNGEALGLLNKRFAEAMDEVKAMAAKTGR